MVLTAAQMRAARALVGMEQRALAEASGVSLPTIQRMEASNGVVRGVIESLTKVMVALEAAGIEFINEGATSTGGGRGVRLRNRPEGRTAGTSQARADLASLRCGDQVRLGDGIHVVEAGLAAPGGEPIEQQHHREPRIAPDYQISALMGKAGLRGESS
jgi:transcriptional regulator with XRE-family HTH domain